MNKLFLAFAAVAMLSAGFMMMNNNSTSSMNMNEHKELVGLFNAWKAEHNKAYVSMEEEIFRFKVFVETKMWIDSNNGGDVEYALNAFSDLTKEEFISTYLGYVPREQEESTVEIEEQKEVDAPASVNWVDQGDVSPIQNQGQCGSCWSFSAAQAIESLYAVKKGQNNPVPVLSEEQLVQCSKLFLNFGCNGGQMTQAFKYVMKNPLTTSTIYPYTSGNGVTGNCNKELEKQGTYSIGGFGTIKNCNELQTNLANQPISVAVDASNWSSYKSGIMTQCGTALNHGVLAVGYQEGSYWLIKNSWGVGWGQNGYIQVGWNNACGVCNSASYPTF